MPAAPTSLKLSLSVLALGLVACPCSAQLLGNEGGFELDFGSTLSDEPAPAAAESEEINPPQLAATEDAEPATAQPHSVRQPVATYDSRTGAWLPDCRTGGDGWMPEIEVPASLIDCACDGQLPGPRCRVWRSFVKPTDPSINPRCVVCVKEPCLDYVTVKDEYRVVIHRCFESTEPFKHEGCEGGRWYSANGTTKLRKLHPCEARVPVTYQKPVVRYRDVYYYIQCANDH